MVIVFLLGSILLIDEPIESDSDKSAQDIKSTMAAASQPRFQVKAGKDDTNVNIISNEEAVIWEITCKSGIDEVVIARNFHAWPKQVVVRLHLAGMESFNAVCDDLTVHWSVSPSASRTLHSLWKAKRETSLTAESPYFTEVKVVSNSKEKYYEIMLPVKLFEGNPQEIRLWWINFYR